MSHQALQRVLVRLLYDPVFAEAVALAPDSALADVPLSQAERGWLAAADPRPFRLDPLRRTRTLRALLDEYPAALALALAAPTRLDVDAFFSSPEFHTAIQDRHALAPRFGAWLAAAAGPHSALSAIADLEAALARLRRPELEAAPRSRDALALSPQAALLTAPRGTSALYGELRQLLAPLAPSPVDALYLTPLDLGRVPWAPPGDLEALLIERRTDDSFDISELPDALAALLAATPAPREALTALARAHGAEPPEDGEIIDDLLAEGLLVHVTQPL
jgi:hypothetical protein